LVDDHRTVRAARFDFAVFTDGAAFDKVRFTGESSFFATTFLREASFLYASFDPEIVADFACAHFAEGASFFHCDFAAETNFGGVIFSGDADFAQSTFHNAALFTRARFETDGLFANARFCHEAVFVLAAFDGQARFMGARFDDDFLGPMLVETWLDLQNTRYESRVNFRAFCRAISLEQARFVAGTTLLLRWAAIRLDGAEFLAPSTIGWSPPWPDLDERRLRDGNDADDASRPHVVSVVGASLGVAAFDALELSACEFASAHGLDGLNTEGCVFATTPAGWSRLGRFPYWTRWDRRDVIAEECEWRRHARYGDKWRLAIERVPLANPDPSPLDPQIIAAIYRALRKGREDAKDEPGAGDFYYGEMEMRRHTRDERSVGALAGWSTDAVVWMYWLVAGYGLRASRALVALALTIGLGAVLFQLVGYQPGTHPPAGYVLFAAESAISLLRQPDAAGLTAWGHVIQILLRLAGPLFFGLAIVSLRGRIKR
jgi:hypothetical protein